MQEQEYILSSLIVYLHQCMKKYPKDEGLSRLLTNDLQSAFERTTGLTCAFAKNGCIMYGDTSLLLFISRKVGNDFYWDSASPSIYNFFEMLRNVYCRWLTFRNKWPGAIPDYSTPQQIVMFLVTRVPMLEVILWNFFAAIPANPEYREYEYFQQDIEAILNIKLTQ